MVIAIAAMSVSFVACGGSTASSEGGENTEVKADEKADGASDIIAQYQALADKMVDLNKKMQSGDAKAVEEYQKVMEDFSNFAQNNQEAFAKLTPEDAQKIQDIMMKATQAMQ